MWLTWNTSSLIISELNKHKRCSGLSDVYGSKQSQTKLTMLMNIALLNLTINSYKKKLEQDSEPHYQTPLQDLQDLSVQLGKSW